MSEPLTPTAMTGLVFMALVVDITQAVLILVCESNSCSHMHLTAGIYLGLVCNFVDVVMAKEVGADTLPAVSRLARHMWDTPLCWVQPSYFQVRPSETFLVPDQTAEQCYQVLICDRGSALFRPRLCQIGHVAAPLPGV